MSKINELIHEFCPEGVPWHHLGELILENLGGGTPSRAKEDFWGGDIPWATIGDITKTELLISNTRQKISQLGLLSSSTNLIPKGWVLVAVKIAPGEMRLVESPLAINQDIRGLRLKPDLDATFLCYWSKTVSIVGNGTIVKGVSKSAIENLKVPLPPLEVQKEIVSILDKLNALVNDTTIGLPAEISARRKQYEYYRNKLLTFKELDAA